MFTQRRRVAKKRKVFYAELSFAFTVSLTIFPSAFFPASFAPERYHAAERLHNRPDQ